MRILRTMQRIVALVVVVALPAMTVLPLSACVIRLGTASESSSDSASSAGSEATSGTSTTPVPPLPEPSVWWVPLPVLTPDQQQRKAEVDQYLAQKYH
jgi:hypothetical protein